MKFLIICSLLGILGISVTPLQDDDDSVMHGHRDEWHRCRFRPEEERSSEYWEKDSRDFLIRQKQRMVNLGSAKNVIMFLGDGMSISTLAGARTYMGQLDNKPGEESWLSFEKFPVTGLSKTYCVDQQVADSACSATAFLGGVKANDGTIGVNAKVCYKDCKAMNDTTNHVDSIAKWFMDKGRSAGIVTTTRVTHASPAGVYAHTAARGWETDANLMADREDPEECRDIAYQLVHQEPGKSLKVILGGGRRVFRNTSIIDEDGRPGHRYGEEDLIKSWQDLKMNEGKTYEYVYNRSGLLNVSSDTEYLLGLFETDHCEYNLRADKEKQPSLEEMVEAALNIISKDDNGYFLFVEGGRIDHGHHNTRVTLALDETVELSKAVDKALSMTSTDDTLIVVTSDHSHVMSVGGYPVRGNNILGTVGYNARDGIPFTSISYGNGPGYRQYNQGQRPDMSQQSGFLTSPNFRYPAMVDLSSETHAGEDVAVFAYGPQQHIFTGVYEQSTIAYLMGYASCVIEPPNACSSASTFAGSLIIIFICQIITKLNI